MTSLRTKIALTVLVFVAIPLAATLARPANEADSAAINKLYADFNDSVNNHDAHAFAMLFTEDADLLQGANNTHGRDAIEQHLASLFSGRAKNLHRDVGDLSHETLTPATGIRFLRPDMAAVYGEYDQRGLMSEAGAPIPPSRGFYDWIVVKQKGRWLISVWHESNIPMPAPAASSAR